MGLKKGVSMLLTNGNSLFSLHNGPTHSGNGFENYVNSSLNFKIHNLISSLTNSKIASVLADVQLSAKPNRLEKFLSIDAIDDFNAVESGKSRKNKIRNTI